MIDHGTLLSIPFLKKSRFTGSDRGMRYSIYKIEEESYYIQTDFTSDDVYLEFLNTIKERSKYDFNVVLNESDKIITLSTCANDKERYVVHAKLIKKSER